MSQAKYKALWHGNCECGKQITFSPDKPFFKDTGNNYKCSCGAEYFINRRIGTYFKLGGSK